MIQTICTLYPFVHSQTKKLFLCLAASLIQLNNHPLKAHAEQMFNNKAKLKNKVNWNENQHLMSSNQDFTI